MQAGPSNAPNVFTIGGTPIDLSGFKFPSSRTISHYLSKDVDKSESDDEETHDVDSETEESESDDVETDVTVITGEGTIAANKALLMARIQYFADLFNSNVLQSSSTVDVSELDLTRIKSLIDFSRTGKITISEENVADLLVEANFLGVESLLDDCKQFLRTRAKVTNVLTNYYLYKAIFGRDRIEQSLLGFINRNFVSISQTKDFLNLSIDLLENILQRDSLNVDDERQVFDAVNRWINHDRDRVQYGPRLLRTVRCTRLGLDFMENTVEKTFWVAENPICMALVEEAKEYISNRAHTCFVTVARTREHAHSLMFAIGSALPTFNHQNNQMNPIQSTLSYYDPITNKWADSEYDGMPRTRVRNGIAVVGKKVYTIGGFNGVDRLNTCDMYDTQRDLWFRVPELNGPRAGMASGAIDEKIIIAGGFDGTDAMDSVEILDLTTTEPTWQIVAPMSKMRGAPASCVYNGKLYVFGGHNGYRICEDCECYDPETNRWTPIAPMKTKRCRFGAAFLDGKIYAVGGFDGVVFMRDVERYDPATDTWETMKQMKTRRSRASVEVSCGKLFVFGGFDGLYNISTVEMYDQATDTWIKREDMPDHAGGIAIASLPIPASFLSPVALLEKGDDEMIEKEQAEQAEQEEQDDDNEQDG